MAQVFAGFVCGYTLALLSTPLLAVALVRLRASSELLARLLPAGASAVAVGVLLHGALFLFWTGFGIVLGLLLLAMEDEAGALGSANGPFTLFVAGLALAIAAPLVVLAPRVRVSAIVAALLVIAIFGWLMPYMAGWTSFGSDEPQRPRQRPPLFQARSAASAGFLYSVPLARRRSASLRSASLKEKKRSLRGGTPRAPRQETRRLLHRYAIIRNSEAGWQHVVAVGHGGIEASCGPGRCRIDDPQLAASVL